jgi:hypothetical protein
MKIRSLAIAPIAAAVLLVGTPAQAVPRLQLDILGGTYDTVTETIMATSNSFSLYAYYAGSSAPTGTFYLSMALQPSSSPAGDYGSFTFNSTPIYVTGDMTYGNPPLETVLSLVGFDPGDLPPARHIPDVFCRARIHFLLEQYIRFI